MVWQRQIIMMFVDHSQNMPLQNQVGNALRSWAIPYLTNSRRDHEWWVARNEALPLISYIIWFCSLARANNDVCSNKVLQSHVDMALRSPVIQYFSTLRDNKRLEIKPVVSSIKWVAQEGINYVYSNDVLGNGQDNIINRPNLKFTISIYHIINSDTSFQISRSCSTK